MSIGTSPEDERVRRIAAEVVSNTLAIAMERAGPHGNVFGHMMSVLDEAKGPKRAETATASDEDLLQLIEDGRRAGENLRGFGSGDLFTRLANSLENEMLDAMHLCARLAEMPDKAINVIVECIDARLAKLQGRVAPDEGHPAEGDIDALKGDLIQAVTEALR